MSIVDSLVDWHKSEDYGDRRAILYCGKHTYTFAIDKVSIKEEVKPRIAVDGILYFDKYHKIVILTPPVSGFNVQPFASED